jgi:Zn-dependent protease with chaperone function
MVAACLLAGTIALSLLGTEAALFTVVSYAGLRLSLAVLTTLSVAPPVALVCATGVCLVGFAAVGAIHRAARRSGDGFAFAPRVLTYSYLALFAASLWLVWTVFQRFDAPLWLQALFAVTVVASVYPAIGYKARDEDGGFDTDIESTEPMPWRETDEETEKDTDADDSVSTFTEVVTGLRGTVDRWRTSLTESAESIRAFLTTAWEPVAVFFGSVGTVGLALIGGAVALGLAVVYVAAATGGTAGLSWPVAAAVGTTVTAVHVGSELRSELAESVVLDDLDDRLGASGDEPTATTERVTARLTRLAGQVDVPVPTVRVVDSRTPVAAAVGYRLSESTVVVSTGLVETLDGAELDAVLAHELAHLTNRDAAVLTALSFPRVAAWRVFREYTFNPLFAVLAVVAGLASRLCAAVVARGREYSADDGAVAITGDPAALASALSTLDDAVARQPTDDLRAGAAFSVVPPAWEEHRFFDRTRRVISRGVFGTHPDTARRIDRLRERERDAERIR